MKLQKSLRRASLLGIAFLVFGWVLTSGPPTAILPKIPRDFVSTAPYVPPTSPPPPFTFPQIITAHCKRDCEVVKMYTSGIQMSVSERNLSAIACRIGSHIVPALSFEYDILQCPGYHLKPGAILAPVLLRDKTLQIALKGPVTLATGVVAELHESDLLPLHGLNIHPSLSSDKLALVPSDYKYFPSPPAGGWRWQVCLMIQIKPATHLLPDWVDYHRRIGVDRVFIFDNGASESIADMFAGRPDVEVISWPYHKAQVALVSFFLDASRDICEHVLHMDADEFYMFGLGSPGEFMEEPPLPRHLRNVKEQGYHHFRLAYITMANSGHLLRPPGPVPENFFHRSPAQFFKNGKSVCSTDEDFDAGLVHSCGIINGRQARLHTWKMNEWGDINMYPTKLDDPGFVVHYRERSWEEWIERTNAGWVVGKLVSDNLKDKLDIDHPDKHFMKFNESLRYTHFRDVYRRASAEGRLDRAYTVRVDALGRRCVREVNAMRQLLLPEVERCWSKTG